MAAKSIPTAQLNVRVPRSWPPVLRRIARERDRDVAQLVRDAIRDTYLTPTPAPKG